MHSEQTRQSSGDWRAFAVSISGTFISTLDSGIVNTALPTIGQGFAASVAEVQWIVAGYFLTISCVLPLFGRLGDMYGRRRVYPLGFLIFTAASMLCGAAPALWALIAARVGQGVGAAILMANSPAIIMAAFPGATRGRALGLVGMTVALGSLIGPGLGGMIIQGFGWRSVFYLNLPFGLFGVWLARRYLTSKERLRDETLDVLGAVLFAVGMVGLLLAVAHGHDWGWTSAPVIIGLSVAVVFLAGFGIWEGRCPHPMLDLSLFRVWPFFSGNVAAYIAFMSMFSNAILMPFYLHGPQGMAPMAMGFVLTSLPLTMGVVAPVSGYLSERINYATLTSLGMACISGSLLWLALLPGDAPLWRVYFGQMTLGLGSGLFMSPNNNSVLSSAPQDKVGLVGGIQALVRNLGMISGIAVATSVFEGLQAAARAQGATPDAAFMTGYRAALTTGSALAASACLLSLYRRRLFRHKPAQEHRIVRKEP
jgi:EmrB/QacA subfamily drug resistance transporter